MTAAPPVRLAAPVAEPDALIREARRRQRRRWLAAGAAMAMVAAGAVAVAGSGAGSGQRPPVPVGHLALMPCRTHPLTRQRS